MKTKDKIFLAAMLIPLLFGLTHISKASNNDSKAAERVQCLQTMFHAVEGIKRSQIENIEALQKAWHEEAEQHRLGK